MTNQLTAVNKLAVALGFTEEEIIKTIKSMVVGAKRQNGAQCSDVEFSIFTSICAKYDLNPLIKEVHAFLSGGRLMFCVGVDGWFKIMSRHPLFDGLENEDIFSSDGKLTAVKAKLYLKGISRPVCATEYLSECYKESSDAWKKYPHRMLENKAVVQAIRRGMGISEFVDEDEKRRIIESQPQEKNITPGAHRQGLGLAEIQAALESAADLQALKATAGDIRATLQAAGTWEIIRGDFLAVYRPIESALVAAEKIKKEAEILEAEFSEFEIAAGAAKEGELIDNETGEVIPRHEEQDVAF